MKWTRGVAIGLLGLAAACGGEDAAGFDGYGTDMPGSGLPLGGELLMEDIYISGGLMNFFTGGAVTDQLQMNTFQVLRYGGAFAGEQPEAQGGGCTQLTHTAGDNDYWPMNDLPSNTEYIDLGDSVTIAGPGIDGAIEVPKIVAGADGLDDGRDGNPARRIDEGGFLYGGPTWQGANFQRPAVTLQEGTYTANLGPDIGEKTFNFPPSYEFAFNSGTDDFNIPATAPEGGWEVTWEAKPNPDTPHSKTHSFVFVTFIELPSPDNGLTAPAARYICLPEDTEDGSVKVPQEVLDAIPPVGMFNTGRSTHYMDAVTDPDGTERRFDYFSIYCSNSLYTVTDE